MVMLDLNELGHGANPGISAAKGAELAEAAAVCMEEQGHIQGIEMAVRGLIQQNHRLDWTPVTRQAHRTWDDNDEATEDGAACIAALIANHDIGQTVIIRARKSTPQQPTGFDYWLGDNDTDTVSDAERAATRSLSPLLAEENLIARMRLEVSGIRNGDDSVVAARVRRKVRQIGRSNALGLPAYVVVVEFGRPIAEVREA